MSRTRKRTRGLKKHTFYLCLTFVLAMSALGIGWGMWSDTLTLGGEVNMGEMKPTVTVEDYYDEDYSGEQGPWVWNPWEGRHRLWDHDIEIITVSGTSETGFTVDISDASMLDKFRIEFSISNEGTVPFHYDLEAGPNHDSDAKVEVIGWAGDYNSGHILDVGQTVTGTIRLFDDNFWNAHETHDLDFGFVFTQYNIEPQ